MESETEIQKSMPVSSRHHLRLAEIRDLWFGRAFIWVVILISLFPTVWVFAASISSGESFFMDSMFPKQVSFDNYKNLFVQTEFLSWAKNSMIICTFVALIQIIQTALAAYAFSRMKFFGRKYGLMSLIILQIFPSVMAISAIYLIVYTLNLQDNIVALIFILSGGSAYNIWLLKGYLDRLPRDYDEAAKIDGASHFKVFVKVIIPLSMPMLVVIFLFSFIGVYSDFIITSIVMQSPDKYTIAQGLRTFIDGRFSANWTKFSAGAVLASLPIMIVFMLLQKYIQSGLAAGGIRD